MAKPKMMTSPKKRLRGTTIWVRSYWGPEGRPEHIRHNSHQCSIAGPIMIDYTGEYTAEGGVIQKVLTPKYFGSKKVYVEWNQKDLHWEFIDGAASYLVSLAIIKNKSDVKRKKAKK